MPRWLYVTLCLLLFTAAMLVLRSVLQATVPGGAEWVISKVGAKAALTGGLVLTVAAGLWAYREHRRQGSARRR
ncbi:hypothetical protein ASF36_23985 [Methylobacterium sp. Leaf90]|nr:hypothetical protein ASF36_23985 [Methylobacterium sp. Leaf90]